MSTTDICAICAWRATCQKKFSMSGRDMHCTDFVKDLALEKKSSEAEEEPKKGEKEEA